MYCTQPVRSVLDDGRVNPSHGKRLPVRPVRHGKKRRFVSDKTRRMFLDVVVSKSRRSRPPQTDTNRERPAVPWYSRPLSGGARARAHALVTTRGVHTRADAMVGRAAASSRPRSPEPAGLGRVVHGVPGNKFGARKNQ